MNCTTCRYELSQCLDGRLPSGRRALVMQHVQQCGDCETFWNELQAAQRLVLQLPSERVSEHFREQLWERIRAGEGSPEAVFREPVPIATKLRYAFVGAAAAALVLFGASLLRPDRAAQPEQPTGPIADVDDHRLQPRIHDAPTAPEATFASDELQLEQNPLLASTRRLTADLVALEAARQLEGRYASVHSTLDRLQRRSVDPDVAVDQVLDNAGEFQSLGELLLELSDRRRLMFLEPEVGVDLRVAVGLLGQTSVLRRDRESITEVVGQALQSRRLGNISRMISVVLMDPREEREVLVRLNHQHPEVFPKLFFVFGSADELQSPVLQMGAFLMDGDCGASWVAPRSDVEARDHLLRLAHRK